MANGETLNEIRMILSGNEPMSQDVFNRLTLSLTAEIYTKLTVLEARQDKIEKKSIIPWIENNKPVALALAILTFIVVVFVPDVLKPVIAKALGLP